MTSPPPELRIVGIGASAGGLAPLEQFLGQVPPTSGLAYVVVQHLDPSRPTLLAHLLQRLTAIPVQEVTNNMPVEPDHVYVIPPNTQLSVTGGRLRLHEPSEPHGQRLPINVLFSSLATALGERAIAVVLSGMGSDGTLGLQAVQAAGGLTVVQQPETAQFAQMPTSAIAAGCGQIVGAPSELPARIFAHLADGTAADSGRSKARASAGPAPLYAVLKLLQEHTGHDFSMYKPSTLQRRIERRMEVHGVASIALYQDFLQRNPQEVALLFRELLIGVTSFFRDPAIWEHLAQVALPDLLARRADHACLRVWSIGCSTGEEAYSLAMVLTEVMQRMEPPRKVPVQIFASDLNPEAVLEARRGRYPLSIRNQITAARLERFFHAHEDHYQVTQSLRDMVLFAQHDVVRDPPFTRLDFIACRNVLIYFNAALQLRLLPLLHYSLQPGGLLLLGSSETVGRLGHLFEGVGEAKRRLYRRPVDANARATTIPVKHFPPLSRVIEEPTVASTNTARPMKDNLQAAADEVLLQTYAPAAVVVSSGGDIVYISGRTGSYLEPAAGKANWNLHAMMREGLRAPLSEAIRSICADRTPLQLRGLRIQVPGAGTQHVNVTVQALQEPASLKGLIMVVFQDTEADPEAKDPTAGRRRGSPAARQAALAADMRRLEDENRLLRQESRSSREELQSANEELQSTNEELQSTNEELTTSKEEMQSMNEELQTINSELQAKLDALALAQSDMQNLLNSTQIAILFLDQDLNVRRFTDRAARFINVRDSDIGRPLSDLTTILLYPQLHEDALQTLITLEPCEKQIVTQDNRRLSVRIIPYRRLDNRIDGVVLTFVDVTAAGEPDLPAARTLQG